MTPFPGGADRPVDLDRERLKMTFNEDAELYDRARPTYLAQVFQDLAEMARLHRGANLLEVGCGTGRATLPLAQRGFRITCVELGENLAAIARRNLAAFREVRVIVEPFEAWDAGAERFDLVYAASAWHWIDPDVGYRKAAELLKPGGSIAIIGGGHAFPPDFDPFFREIQKAYEAIGESEIVHWPLPEEVPDLREEIEATGLFSKFESRRYVWELMYTAEEYIDLLNTFSGHIAQEPEKREYLYRNIRERINARADPRVRRHWLTILNVARRL